MIQENAGASHGTSEQSQSLTPPPPPLSQSQSQSQHHQATSHQAASQSREGKCEGKCGREGQGQACMAMATAIKDVQWLVCFQRLFYGLLPLPCVLRVVDAYLVSE